jgi:hypothetical protein
LENEKEKNLKLIAELERRREMAKKEIKTLFQAK